MPTTKEQVREKTIDLINELPKILTEKLDYLFEELNSAVILLKQEF